MLFQGERQRMKVHGITGTTETVTRSILRGLMLALFAANAGFSEPEGTIVGSVRDTETKIPLVGVNIVLEGTTLGATTDAEGKYIIPNLPPGEYSLRASLVGYRDDRSENVRVTSTMPVRVDFELQQRIVQFEEISVTAARTEKDVFQTHHAVTVAQEEEIERRTPRTTPEILREEVGIFVQKTTHGHGAPVVRGLMGYNVLVLIDGIRLNNSTFRYGPNQYVSTVDPKDVERIEVVRRPGSVLYGSDAQGGVINIITKGPGNVQEQFRTSLVCASKYSSADKERMGRLELKGGHRKLGFSIGATYRDVGDLRAGGDLGIESPTGWREIDGNITLWYQPSEKHRWRWIYQAVRQKDVPRYDQYPEGRYATGKKNSGAYATYLYSPQNRDLLFVDYRVSHVAPYIEVLRATISYHRQNEGRKKRKEGETLLTVEEDNTRTLGIGIQLNSSLGRRHRLTYGVEAYRDDIGSERRDTEVETGLSESKRSRYPDGSSFQSYAVYVQDEVSILPNVSVSVGGRYSCFGLKADLQDSTFGAIDAATDAVTGSFGAVYGLTHHVNVTLSIAQAFRTPNVDDETTFGDFHAGIEVPSPGLNPEKSITYEIGLKVRSRSLSGAVAAYVTELDDLIDREPSTYHGSPTLDGEQVWRKVNINEARIKGFEAHGEWFVVPSWSLFGHFTWTSGRDLSRDEPLRRIPPAFGFLGVQWSPLQRRLWVECFSRFATRQDKLSADDEADVRIPIGGTPGWITHNIRAGFHVTDVVRASVGLENILDKAYREHGSGIDGPGRCFIVSSEISI
ncbi:MAG: TonB-dependent receptor [Gemmatimonadota bacterium]|nr:MAG: TonB-dependent receptor [Gemmatimonadota bacterium]